MEFDAFGREIGSTWYTNDGKATRRPAGKSINPAMTCWKCKTKLTGEGVRTGKKRWAWVKCDRLSCNTANINTPRGPQVPTHISESRQRYDKREWNLMAGMVAIVSPSGWDGIRDVCIETIATDLQMMSNFMERMTEYGRSRIANEPVPEWAEEWLDEVGDVLELGESGAALASSWCAALAGASGNADVVAKSMEIPDAHGKLTPQQVRSSIMSGFTRAYAYYLEDLFDHVCAATEHQINAMKDD